MEFLILHYTAGELETTLELLTDPSTQASSHLVISRGGHVFELVKCWDGVASQAWHAGRSHWFDGKRTWNEFNNFAIGIELVNLNGNIFAYTDEQYEALTIVVGHLQSLYPALKSPARILGHEHIAGWRGKADPGHMFDWKRFFHSCYPNMSVPLRAPICPLDLKVALEKLSAAAPADTRTATRFWQAVNHLVETAIRLMHEGLSQPSE